VSAPIRIAAAVERVSILVNANAKRGGRRVAVQIARALPGANVKLTRTQAEMDSWLRSQLDSSSPPQCFLAAGGDGTVVALVNALARVVHGELPPFGILPLGTGNAWANSTGAPKLRVALSLLDEAGSMGRAMPVRRFGLAIAKPEGGTGVLTHMAGSGWDAQILNDYKDQLSASPSAKSVYGYLGAMFFRTTPNVILHGRANVVIESLDDEVYAMRGRSLVRLEAKRGAILWDGSASVAGVATCPEYGYRFKSYPHAERFLGKLSVRVYDRSALGGIRDITKLWMGAPLDSMHDWFARGVRMTFSRPTPMQIGGDAVGLHRVVEYTTWDREAHVLDWRLLR
jgi:diacylglycerol kinase family enzyme